MKKLGTTTIRGKEVSFFEPPHKDGPDFPWVDVKELAGAFLPPDAADHWPLSFEALLPAFHNPGGHSMRSFPR